VSVDGGETWTGQAYPTAQIYHVATTRDVPYHVCGAQQDSTTICVSSAPAGRGMSIMYSVGGGESGYIAPHPVNPNIFYAGSQVALLTRFDRATNQLRDVQVYPVAFSGMSAGSLKERWQWTYPIVFSPLDPGVLYTSSQHLWRTTNEGQSWEKISPDLTRADPKTLVDSGGPITHDQNGPEIYGTIFTIAPSRFEKDTIWTGSDDGLVYITRDGGKNWKNVTPRGMPDFIRISLIEASPHNKGAAYVAAKNYQADDRKPYAYRTEDYGETWTPITSGIAGDDFVHAVREDPKRAGLLFAGTEHGIYISFDNGAQWQSLRLNLPDTQVADLMVEGDDLVIATHGRSFYILDNITILRELASGVPMEATHLFTPRDAVRPLNRAVIDYYLAKPADTVTIDFLDPSGQVVRSFVSSPGGERRRPATADNAADAGDDENPRGGGQRPPSRAAGGNRFTWDLRYPGATTFEGMILWQVNADQGPVAVPGEYRVRITANGVTQTRAFHIVKDARLTSVSDADLAEQFKLAIAARDKTTEANTMVIRIRDLKKTIAEKVKADPALNAAAERLTTRLSAVEEDLYQVRNKSFRDPMNYPIKLNNQLATLVRVIESADSRPTDQSYDVLKELSARLEEIRKRLDEILRNDSSGLLH
jgi:Sortilin, neurotensin receptor 3,